MARGISRSLLLGGGWAEDVGAQQFEILTPRARNASFMPLTNRWRSDAAKTCHLCSTAEGLDDFGVGMDVGHAPNIGLPIAYVNSHTYTARR